MLIHRLESCIGITLFSWKKWLVELWICPPGYQIREHVHPEVDIRLIPIYGEAHLSKNGVLHRYKKERLFKAYPIAHNERHFFTCIEKYFVFVNIEHWLGQKTSASESLTYV